MHSAICRGSVGAVVACLPILPLGCFTCMARSRGISGTFSSTLLASERKRMTFLWFMVRLSQFLFILYSRALLILGCMVVRARYVEVLTVCSMSATQTSTPVPPLTLPNLHPHSIRGPPESCYNINYMPFYNRQELRRIPHVPRHFLPERYVSSSSRSSRTLVLSITMLAF